MSLAFGDSMDDFWQRNRPLLDAMRHAAVIRRALEPYERVRELQRMHDATQPFRVSFLQAQVVEEALRHLQEMRPVASQLAAIQDTLIDPLGPTMSAVRDALRQQETLRDVEAVTNAIAVADRQMELVRSLRFSDEVHSLLRTIEAQRAVMDAANAMLTSVPFVEAGVSRDVLVSALADALGEDAQVVENAESGNLLAYVISLAIAIREKAPDVNVTWLVMNVLVPLFIGLLSGGVFYVAAARDGERALVRIERAIQNSRPEKRWITVREINLREFDGRNAKVLAKVPAGTLIMEVDRAGDWRLVRVVGGETKEQTGWVYYRGLRVPKDTELNAEAKR